jgi:hypothetical protein
MGKCWEYPTGNGRIWFMGYYPKEQYQKGADCPSMGISLPLEMMLSMYTSMASFAISKASSMVSPKVKHPGSDGTITVYVPSVSGLIRIL